jgi:hypothetical protein
MAFDVGPVNRWKTPDGILWSKNDFVLLAWFATDDPKKVNSLGVEGQQKMVVKYITIEQAKLWDGCECRQS